MNETAAWAFVAGVVLATFSGVVVPFLTGTLTRRSERVTQTLLNRPKALDEWLDVRAKCDEEALNFDLQGPSPSALEQTAALDRLESQFTTSDQEARTALLRFVNIRKSEDLAVVSTWAAGRELRATLAGRRVAKSLETSS